MLGAAHLILDHQINLFHWFLLILLILNFQELLMVLAARLIPDHKMLFLYQHLLFLEIPVNRFKTPHTPLTLPILILRQELKQVLVIHLTQGHKMQNAVFIKVCGLYLIPLILIIYYPIITQLHNFSRIAQICLLKLYRAFRLICLFILLKHP